MNIAKTVTGTVTPVEVTKTTIYVNVDYQQIALDVASGALEYQYDGKGKIIVDLPEEKEDDYLFYSDDKAQQEKIVPPFDMNNGDLIKFSLQDYTGGKSEGKNDSNIKCSWKGIIQPHYDLRLVSGKNSTYKAVIETARTPDCDCENDDIIIKTSFKLKNAQQVTQKYAVSWDPRIRIKRG